MATKMLHVVDAHAGGEPARVVVGGLPMSFPGANTMYEIRQHFMDHLDHLRQLLILEPRGYPCQNVDFIVPPCSPDAAYGFIIGEQAKVYPLMSGHNTICVATVLLETGMIEMKQDGLVEFVLEAPGGLVPIKAICRNGKVLNVAIHNVTSFVHHLDVTVKVPHLGDVRCSVAYGGMHYCVVDVHENKDVLQGMQITTSQGKTICRYGEMIKTACREQYPVNHPEMDYPGCDILAFVSNHDAKRETSSALNTVVMSNGVLDWDKPDTWTGMLDRSPCGTGTCAIMAIRHAKSMLQVGEPFHHESIVGSVFVGEILEETTIQSGDDSVIKAIKPMISGRAWITQFCQVMVDPTDPFKYGFTVADIW